MARYVVGITGASGALYAQRVLRGLLEAGHEVHLCCTPMGLRLLHDELGIERLDESGLAVLCGLSDSRPAIGDSLCYHPPRDVGAPIASGSFLHDGMVIVPCSSRTLNCVAAGTGDTLVARAAAVCLKERRPLILAHRESPLSLIDIRAMETLTQAGAVVAPCNPGLYLLPRTVEEVVDFVAARLLDLLKVEHQIGRRWGERSGFPSPWEGVGGRDTSALD